MPHVDHERLCPACHGTGGEYAVTPKTTTRTPCAICNGSGWVDDREAWSDQEVVPGVRRDYLTALEDVARVARRYRHGVPCDLDDALAALDAATKREEPKP